MAKKLPKGIRQIVYVEEGNRPVGVFELPKKRLDIGDKLKLDGKPYVVWYVEETALLRNVRVEVVS